MREETPVRSDAIDSRCNQAISIQMFMGTMGRIRHTTGHGVHLMYCHVEGEEKCQTKKAPGGQVGSDERSSQTGQHMYIQVLKVLAEVPMLDPEFSV